MNDEYNRSLDYFAKLCMSLHMDFVCDENTEYFVHKGYDGENHEYKLKNGHDELFEDRGDLFVALRNVAVNLVPNVLFRSEDYIYTKYEGEK